MKHNCCNVVTFDKVYQMYHFFDLHVVEQSWLFFYDIQFVLDIYLSELFKFLESNLFNCWSILCKFQRSTIF